MTYFITGIAGFLGSHLAKRLLADGAKVIGCDNLIGGYKDNVPEGAVFYEVDCGDLEKMTEIMKDTDVVYHCACTAYEGLSVFSPRLVVHNTVDITASVLSAAIVNRVKRFVYLSSMARYGANMIPFVESMKPAPQDPYGISKYASELLVKNLCETHGIEWSVAIPHNIIGPGQKYDDPYRNVAAIFINLMLQKRAPIIYGDGMQQRCFSFVDDVVEPLRLMGTLPEAAGEAINIGPDHGLITIRELFDEIARIVEFVDGPKFLPDRPREVKYANCSAMKARRILKYEPKIRLHEGLEKMVEWIKERGTKEFDYHLPLEIVSDLTPETWKKKLY